MKILAFGDLNQIQNVFGVYDSTDNKVHRYSWLDVYQDIKFDGVRYLNLESSNSKTGVAYVYGYKEKIPKTLDDFKKKHCVYVVGRNSDGTCTVLTLPECNISRMKDLAAVYENTAYIPMNFRIGLSKKGNQQLYVYGIRA